MQFYSAINGLKERQQLESKWLMNLLANRINMVKDVSQPWHPAEPRWCLDKQRKALYTDLAISSVKLHLQLKDIDRDSQNSVLGKRGVS